MIETKAYINYRVTFNLSTPSITNKLSVAVYDVEDKKLVMLFHSRNLCSRYLYTDTSLGGCHSTKVREKVQAIFRLKDIKNRKCNRNSFNRMLAFRSCTEEQLKMLGEELIVILDERYLKSEKFIKSLYSQMEK